LDLKDLLNDPPKVHPYNGQLLAWGLPRPALDFIDEHVTEGSKTLETGSGLSTILFALKGASHLCITPFQEEVDRIREYCQRRGVSLQSVDFRVGLSTSVLPELGPVELDLALIDGCHGFPTPFMDWYFTASRLKIGGAVVVDDVQIWTGRVLRDFLALEPEWRLIEPFSDKTAIFVKERHYDPWKEFEQQLYVVQQDELLERPESKFSKGLRLLRQGQILTLVRKMANQVKGDQSLGRASEKEHSVVMPPCSENAGNAAEAVPRLARRAAEQAVRATAASENDAPEKTKAASS
jgi:Methyltransferase domain